MAEAKTILFVSPWQGTIGPNVGLRQLVLGALRRGHRVHVAAPGRDQTLEELEASGAVCHLMAKLELLPRHRCPLILCRHLLRAWLVMSCLGKLARRVGADVIYVNGENMLLAPRSGRRCGCPAVVAVRGLRFVEIGRVGRWYFRLQRRWVHTYVAVSHSVGWALQDIGVPSPQVRVVYNGVDVERYRPGSGDPRLASDLGIRPDQRVIGAVMYLDPRKGAHHLVEAFGEVAREAPDVVCLIVGAVTRHDQAYARGLRQAADAMGVGDRVIFAGGRQDVPDLLRLMDLVVHPSETESFGRVIAEAMACEKAVVGFDVPAVNELVEDGRTGRLVPPFDHRALSRAIVELLDDPPGRRQMGRAGRAKAAAEYDLRKTIAQTLDIMEGAAEPRRAGSTP